MDCKKVSEELVFLFADDAEGQDHEMHGDYSEHVSRCPHCSQRAYFVRKVLTVVRTRAIRWSAPKDLRERIILACMTHRAPRER